MSLSDPSAQKDTTEFALPTKIRFAKQRTKQNAKPSTKTIVMRLTETFKSPMLKMFAMIKMSQYATNIGNVKIQIFRWKTATIKFGLIIKLRVST